MSENLRTVSIITVTYNSEKTIVATMESVLAQTYLALTQESKGSPTPLIEYLVVDGASKDRTVEIAESFRVRMEEAGIRLRIQSEPDQGIYDAMNKGIRMATGDIIGIINSDDWYEPEAVETAVETFAAAGCDAMFANIRLHRADGSSFVKKARQRRFQRLESSNDVCKSRGIQITPVSAEGDSRRLWLLSAIVQGRI